MSDTVKAAVILASALIVAAVLNGGVYQVVVSGAGSGGSQDVAGDTEFRGFRVNRISGTVMVLVGPLNNILIKTETLQEYAAEHKSTSPTTPQPQSTPFAGTEVNPNTMKPIAPGWVWLGAGWWCQSQTDYRQRPHCLRALRPEEVVPRANPMASP